MSGLNIPRFPDVILQITLITYKAHYLDHVEPQHNMMTTIVIIIFQATHLSGLQ